MRKLYVFAVALALASSASAAPNVGNVSQKGSLLMFPDIRVDDGWNTLIRIQNDQTTAIDVTCYWMDGNKNRLDFHFQLGASRPFWFDARTGNGTLQVAAFPAGPAGGIDNPFLVPDAAADENTDVVAEPYFRGLLVCWATDPGLTSQVKWNHLAGTATVYNLGFGAYEYNAFAFSASGIDGQPVGVAGVLELDGTLYDQCPLFVIGQFTPAPIPLGNVPNEAFPVEFNRLAVNGCKLNLTRDFVPVYTKLEFDVWNAEEVKFTGAYECADSWHETTFVPTNFGRFGGPFDSAAQNFAYSTLQTYSARYRISANKSTQCPFAEAVGLVGVQSTQAFPGLNSVINAYAGTTLTASGKQTGRISWTPAGTVPEGGIQ